MTITTSVHDLKTGLSLTHSCLDLFPGYLQLFLLFNLLYFELDDCTEHESKRVSKGTAASNNVINTYGLSKSFSVKITLPSGPTWSSSGAAFAAAAPPALPYALASLRLSVEASGRGALSLRRILVFSELTSTAVDSAQESAILSDEIPMFFTLLQLRKWAISTHPALSVSIYSRKKRSRDKLLSDK